MGFQKFGFVTYTSQTRLAEFGEFIAAGKLMGNKCLGCGGVYFPPRADCPGCLGGSMEWVEIKGPGELVSFTRVNYAPAGFEEDVPYFLALARFEGFKVFGRLGKSLQAPEVKIGMAVDLNFVKLPNSRFVYEFVKI